MAKTNLTLVQKKKKRGGRIAFLIILLAFVAIALYLIITQFSTEKIQVEGATSYTDAEVEKAVRSKYYVPNTLVMTVESAIFSQKYLPFIQTIHMQYSNEDYHVLRIKIKEKLRAGSFSYMNRNVYFDEDGIALESRINKIDHVPEVSGVRYNKLELGKQIPVKGNYFDKIMSITKRIQTYNIDVSKIHFRSKDDIVLTSGNYKIRLGSTDALDGKMSKINDIKKSLHGKYSSGTIDMHLYTDEQNLINFKENR